MRVIPIVLAVLFGACRCNPPTHQATGDLRAMPTALDFGDVAIGASLPLMLELDDTGQAPADATLTVDGPFTLSATSVSTGGGGSTTVTVTFAPSVVGAASGTVRITGVPDVPLTGNGLPPCVPSQACVASAFDLTSRRCVETPLAEGTTCTAACLAGAGSCRQGYCVGNATSCIDGDLCTLDVCTTDGGCLNPPLVCPVTDPCQAQFCDSQTGCGSMPLDDGTPCGSANCESAHICFGGHCEEHQRPNAATDCRYTALQSGELHTCAVTVGGGLRCWGGNDGDWQGRGFPSKLTSPGLAVSVGPVRAVGIGPRSTTWASLPSGQLASTNTRVQLPIDATLMAVGFRDTVCGIEQGEVRCAEGSDGGSVATVASNATALSMSEDQLCVAHSDGGVECGTPSALASIPLPGPAIDVGASTHASGCALIGDGVRCWGDFADGGSGTLWSSGVTALATSHITTFGLAPVACAGFDAGIACFTPTGFDARVTNSPTPPVSALAIGSAHGCALHDDGRVSCWGNNSEGQFGDRSTQPVGVQAPTAQADWLGRFDGVVLFARGNDPVLGFSVLSVRLDAGVYFGQPLAVDAGGSTSSYTAGCPCGFDAGSNCGEWGTAPAAGAVACTTWNWSGGFSDLCVARVGGDVRCSAITLYGNDGGVDLTWNAGGEVTALASETGGTGLCAVRADGTVACCGVDGGNAVAEGLTQVKQLCLGDATRSNGCALQTSGQLLCWGDWVGSATPIVPSAAWPATRQVSCGHQHFCALSGINIVKCWGDNLFGQLGRDGPSRTIAADVPMSGPVKSIAAGTDHTCALLQSGDVVCWGDNTFGQLGLPLLYYTAYPLPVDQ
jgi:hypothetical protein